MTVLANFYSFLVLPSDEVDPEKGKILWLIRLRWIFLFIQFVFVIPFLIFNTIYFKEMAFYVGLSAILTVFNSTMHGVWKNSETPLSNNLTFICLLVDLLWFTVLFWFLIQISPIHAENIYFIHAGLGAVLLHGRKNIIFYTLIAFCFFGIQFYQYNYFPYNEFISIAVFNQIVLFCVWGITSSVSKYVFSQREQLSQMKIYAEKMDRLRAIGALTAGFSHEFASPLNTIKLRVNRLAKKNGLEDEDIEATKLAVLSCEKIIRHINHSQMDKRDFLFQQISLQRFFSEIVESWKLDRPEARLKINYNTQIPERVEIATINFSQGLLNVLDNAYESNSKNSIMIDVSINEGRLHVCVSDDGEGFSKDVIERFGEPFLTTKKEGTGLGLYSFLLFAQSIGGSVSIGNLSPKGAFVKFTSPLKALS